MLSQRGCKDKRLLSPFLHSYVSITVLFDCAFNQFFIKVMNISQIALNNPQAIQILKKGG